MTRSLWQKKKSFNMLVDTVTYRVNMFVFKKVEVHVHVSVNTIHPEPEIHEHIYVTKRPRNNVHDYKHILTYIETNENNHVNGTTHTDELTVQHWAHCTPFVDVSSNLFTLSHWLKGLAVSLHSISSMDMRTGVWLLSSSLFPSTSCSTSPSSSSCFSPWRTVTPWITPCATPQSGALSAWTIAHPTQCRALNASPYSSCMNLGVPQNATPNLARSVSSGQDLC